jgi:hypothetical protein
MRDSKLAASGRLSGSVWDERHFSRDHLEIVSPLVLLPDAPDPGSVRKKLSKSGEPDAFRARRERAAAVPASRFFVLRFSACMTRKDEERRGDRANAIQLFGERYGDLERR